MMWESESQGSISLNLFQSLLTDGFGKPLLLRKEVDEVIFMSEIYLEVPLIRNSLSCVIHLFAGFMAIKSASLRHGLKIYDSR